MRYLIFIIVAFCSCTSSGKLTDAKFPYNDPESGIIWAAPVSVGSYTIKAALIDWAALKRQQDKYDMYVYSFLIGFLLICFLIIGWAFWRKDEEITIPDDTTLKL